MDMDAADAASAAVWNSACGSDEERTSIELEQPIEMTFEEDGIFRYTLTAPIDGMRVQVEWLTESKDFTSLKIAGRTAYGTNGIYNLGRARRKKNVDLSASSSAENFR